MNARVAFTAAVLLAPVQPVLAQVPAADSVLIENEYTDSLQVKRVMLYRRAVYRLETGDASVQPRFVPVRPGTYPPTALRVLERGRLGGPVYEVHVDRDGEYDLGVGGLRDGGSVRIRLTTDNVTTRAAQARRDQPRWSIGVRAEVGHHAGYLTTATPDSPEGGILYDGCVVISNGARFDLCLGGGYDSRGERSTRVSWIFAELYVRAISLNRGSRHQTDLGLMGRVAQGGAGSAITRDPSFYGVGVVLEQWLTRAPSGRGISLRLTGLYGWLRNITIKGETTTVLKGGLQWLP